MEIKDFGEIIAERRFRVKYEPAVEVIVAIGKPMPFTDSEGYYVPYQIKGVGNERLKFTGGVDAIQCLQLVMKIIGSELMAFNESIEINLVWDGDENGGLGFPF